ncbi:hypothetical protein PA598K_00436 [Paenibacillus sp. 598K]|uniref:class I SAM-dependent methyltransferase n=1 Tax=Paenibacillus sp. 598K TaxID=1117987 RepID=UPI000FFAC0CA|nr:class I SAM-dependent methyltransferase [Paenibacillus sp. 598K]GBF72199.1 hypothetical protein PA598K_00436 [Paenibacillus sp. 598K]
MSFWEGLLSRALGERRGQRVLDVGTGPGFLSILLARIGHRPTAVDASPGMIERAASIFRQYGCEATAYLADAEDLSSEADGSYDAVVCRDVVWTLPDPQRAYAEWHRVLKPGGKLIVFDGNYLYPAERRRCHALRYALSWLLILLTEGRVRRRSRDDRALLQELPFTQVMRPEADEQALRLAGFGAIAVQRDYIPRGALPMHDLKYGYQDEQRFEIIATKE